MKKKVINQLTLFAVFSINKTLDWHSNVRSFWFNSRTTSPSFSVPSQTLSTLMLSTSPFQFNHLLFSLLLPLGRHYAHCGASSKHLVLRMCTIEDDDICTPLSGACAKRFGVTRIFQGGKL
ncbi:unnamed protein product [Ixodes pacificus]